MGKTPESSTASMRRLIIERELSHVPRRTLFVVLSVVVSMSLSAVLRAQDSVQDRGTAKTESFDSDPLWPGVNNRRAREEEPVTIRQDFGYSDSANAGGRPGELGGFISPAGEAAYYSRVLDQATFDTPLRASGTLACPDGSFHVLLGFFNARATKEWRTPNTIALRLNGRGDHFYTYVEYCTSRWRAGGDTTPFPSKEDPATGRRNLIGFPSGGKVYRWTLAYDPAGSDGRGMVTASIDDNAAVCVLDEGHRSDGAVFDRFGLLNVIKSADTGGEMYLDDIAVNGVMESFDEDPRWDGKNNGRTYPSRLVRPRFDFGYSPTRFAGGRSAGEIGGTIFRGDCRYPERMASFGDVVGPLTLRRPFRASGVITLRRGVSDSTTLFGFFNSRDSLRRSDAQSDSIPASVAGIHIEGPSRDGFAFYPVFRAREGGGVSLRPERAPRIYPDGASHRWSL